MWLVWPVLVVCSRISESMLLLLLLGSPLAVVEEMRDGCRHTAWKKSPKLNHVVIMNYDGCACDKLNCYCVYGGGKWLMLHNLGILEIHFFLKWAGIITYLAIELPSAVFTGYVRAGIVPVQQDKNSLILVAWKLIFVCHLVRSIKTREKTNGDQEAMCSS